MKSAVKIKLPIKTNSISHIQKKKKKNVGKQGLSATPSLTVNQLVQACWRASGKVVTVCPTRQQVH